MTIEGDNIDYEKVAEAIEQAGAVIHSIDSVSSGKRLIDETRPYVRTKG